MNLLNSAVDSPTNQTNSSAYLSSISTRSVIKGMVGFSVSALLAISASAQIAAGTTGIDNTGIAANEMAACNNGTTQQSRADCVAEVRSATATKRAGSLDNANAQFKTNALMRCDALQGEDKVACEARVAGLGNPQGSVAGGGVLTQVETVVVPENTAVMQVQTDTISKPVTGIPAK